MGREITPSEMEDLTIERINVGAVGQNAWVCRCGRIEHSPNTEVFRNCVFYIPSCDWCNDRDWEPHP